ncbi:Clan CA, family C1, cathepsin L-like cysteine peptidase [Tritrichomonas foetus]|uniref:Clan CA, family C1, cathepsin L-like cysteine peptidase n=1 Tax=Tritrichomonas foetus TaxID=1144522 RepID=A0A1J4KDB7_9EUKA|nr:Clan CA, family C1, cathepsin L-like cysteine peptidase [Tritrichomonas foetus]|eukprot:OHT07453.1 Clan CA, family C1, cathepsin L-like cysteine peptidase [Tritrichomonas foetus]
MLGFFLCALASPIELPNWPTKYRFKGTWNIPYWNVKQPFYVSVNRESGHECVAENSLNGYQHSIHCLGKYTVSRQVYTNITEENEYIKSDYCVQVFLSEEKAKEDTIVEYLPTDNNEWKYQGEFIVLGKKAHKWQKVLNINDWYYDFYADAETLDPIRLFQHGQSIKHSHPTDYILDFEEFGPTIDESEFYIPPDCGTIGNTSYGPTRKFNRDISLKKSAASKKDESYNYGPDYQPYCEQVTAIDATIPSEFSWRNYPGVLPIVRDQASCGSCWAQAAGEAASSQFSLRSNQNVSVSVQQIVDCAWGEGVNNACDGGEGWEGYYLLKKRQIKLVSEDEMPYLGVGGYCPTSVQNPIGYITGCKQIAPPTNEKTHELLKKAVYKYGPLMVSIRAGVDPFVQLTAANPYYSNEQYCNAEGWPSQVVDHGVLLTGWKVHEGKTYLEIMNSWSTSWGDEGFGYIDEQYDCGINSMVLLPTVEFI